MTELEPAQLGFDLGVDTHIARKMANIILDTSIELPPSGRTNQENLGKWSVGDVVGYSSWLCQLLGIDPKNPDGPHLSQTHLSRASKLNIGPSTQLIDNVVGNNGLTRLNLMLGNENPHLKFKDSERKSIVDMGVSLADQIGGRPSGTLMDELRQQGKFPGRHYIIEHFGSLGNYYELIGRPHPRGWEEEDYLDWIVAFFRQNGPDARLTIESMNTLSNRGTGPSRRALELQNIWEDHRDFEKQGKEEYWRRVETEEVNRAEQMVAIKDLQEHDETFADVMSGLEGDERLKAGAQYRLAQRLTPDLQPAEYRHIAGIVPSDRAVEYIVKNGNQVNKAIVEVTAARMGIFDTLWPMYRFQNADLHIAA